MKKVIDVKSLVIGVLATALLALFFTMIDAKSRNNANFDTITVKKIKIVHSSGSFRIRKHSVNSGGAIYLFNRHGELVVEH